MNDKNNGILSKITIEARTEVIKELFSDVAGLIDKSDAKMAKLVEILKQQKEAVGHGNWIPYLKEHFGGDAAVKRVQYYMRKVDESNSRIFNYLEDGEPATVPRSARKPADVVVSTPAETTETEVDDDPTPDPPTQRKTAKGSEKVNEDNKPRTQQVPVEIIEEDEPAAPFVSDPFEYMTFGDIIAVAVSKLADDQKKKAAKELRKHADKLDPPTKTAIPTVERMTCEIPEEWSDHLRDAACMWARYRQGLVKAKRIQSIEAWIAALEHMGEQAEEVVVRKIRTAVESSWQGWDVEKANGKANGNGHSGRTSKTSDQRFDAKAVFG